MENVTQAVQDELVKSLDYKLGSSNVNYIQSRRDVQYYPSSLSTFTPTTSRVARIPLTSGMDFIDPESLKIAFRVRNNDATLDLNPGTQEPSCFIKRVQLFANGQRCDDISEYGRCCFLYSLLKPSEWYKNKGITGFWELAGLVPAPIPAQNYKDVLMAPTLIGMFQAGKFLPPQLNLVLELQFADPADARRRLHGLLDRKRPRAGEPGDPGLGPLRVLPEDPAQRQEPGLRLPAALQGQVAALPAAPDLTPYALVADLAAAEGLVAANASGLTAVNTSLTLGLASKANQSALDALQVQVDGKSTPASVDLKLMNSSIASTNNTTLATVAATYALKSVVDQLAIDVAARQTAADVDQRVATALLSYLTQTAYQAGQALQDARLDGHDAEILALQNAGPSRHGRGPQHAAAHPAICHRRDPRRDRHPRRRHQPGQRPRLAGQRDRPARTKFETSTPRAA